jgi:hypothetical protein
MSAINLGYSFQSKGSLENKKLTVNKRITNHVYRCFAAWKNKNQILSDGYSM